ncbi:iron chelate uptake ABC transporter family permease subunit [Streptococcaceae bacterium ESL0729]|nr:iron chelate uptake ABC transporter family permease subunit [Streptococcaceae bacterium ESL0729]
MLREKNYWLKISFTAILAGGLIFLYLTYNTYGNWEFALALRGKRLIAFILVALASSVSTVSFQTLTTNRLLSPGILGLDNLYVLIQTFLFFIFGGVTMLSQESTALFLGTIFLMTLVSTLAIVIFTKKEAGNLFEVLMIGIISGTFFSSISSFLQVVMNPNEYDMLQGKLFASFSNVNTYHMLLASLLIALGVIYFFAIAGKLDVMQLGRDTSINLGLDVSRIQMISLILISVLTATSTALVGPTVFLGFILSTISRAIFKSFDHRYIFLASSLIGIVMLVGGQFLVEQVFGFTTTISVIIQFLGGLIFIGKIIGERKYD